MIKAPRCAPPCFLANAQMGVLCVAVHVPAERGRLIIVTGGDDQAVCVAEVEVLPDLPTNEPDERIPQEEARSGYRQRGEMPPSGRCGK